MLIINEDTLIHTDSSSDIIEHFGVKGMDGVLEVVIPI